MRGVIRDYKKITIVKSAWNPLEIAIKRGNPQLVSFLIKEVSLNPLALSSNFKQTLL
jgi:ankyrin repeat protein